MSRRAAQNIQHLAIEKSDGQPRLAIFIIVAIRLLIGSAAFAQQPARATNEPIKIWSSLTAAEATKGLPVELKGTILCYDLAWGQLYVYDGLNAIYLNPRAFSNRFEVGQQVKISGVTAWDGSNPVLTNVTAIVEGRQTLPAAKPLHEANLAESVGQWIEISGEVRVAEASRERVTLVITDGNQKFLVYVMQTTSADRFRQFADCVVKIRGINASRIRGGKVESAIVFCPGPDQITMVKPSEEDRWTLPVTPINTLLAQPLGSWTNLPVHLNGLVSFYSAGDTITIKDPTGELAAEIIQVTPVLADQRVDLWGFLAVRSNHAVLADAYFQIMGRPRNNSPLSTKSKIVLTNDTAITEISQVRSLTKEQANHNLPARVRGVLTFVDTEWRVAFLQDDNAAVFIDTMQSDLQSGQYVEVTGQTDGRGFAPELINCTTTILGTTNYPRPIKSDVQDAADGHLDARWVEMQGVVRHVSKENGHISLNLTSPAGKFIAIVLDLNTNGAPLDLVDAQVMLRGVCGSTVNSRGQLSAITLHVSSRQEIKVVNAGPTDLFATPAIPIASVATFNRDRFAGRRIKVSGVVTLAGPGQDLFLQDASGGIRIIISSEANNFQVGDRLDVLGFPALRDFSPCLEEAAIRQDGTGTLAQPKVTTAAQILRDGTYDGLRIELKGRVLQTQSKSAQAELLLQDGSIIFTAHLAGEQEKKRAAELAVDSIVKLRGVCVIQGSENNEPENFRLLVTGPEDLVVLESAPWWTARHAMVIVSGTTLATLLASGWVFLLRRQVRQQTAIIRQNQNELVESSRLAGMAEVATNVLHNVGNVLNSVNISASLVAEKIQGSSAIKSFSNAVALIERQGSDLGDFITHDPRGKKLPTFLIHLEERFRTDNESQIKELDSLRKNIDHIKEIVAMQLTLARVGAVFETVAPEAIVEDALLINFDSLARHGVQLKRDYDPAIGKITTDKHKLLQVMVNLISNAKNACAESGRSQKEIIVRVKGSGEKIHWSVEDNGVGILPENLVRIFNHGFTTRTGGHGFGLHSGAIAAKQMGGRITVESEGIGHGARFILELPITNPSGATLSI